MVEANPTTPMRLGERRVQWATGLLQVALFESREDSMEVVLASQCEVDSCEYQFCDVQRISLCHGQSSYPESTIVCNDDGAPFLVTMTPTKVQLRARCPGHPSFVPWSEEFFTRAEVSLERHLYNDC